MKKGMAFMEIVAGIAVLAAALFALYSFGMLPWLYTGTVTYNGVLCDDCTMTADWNSDGMGDCLIDGGITRGWDNQVVNFCWDIVGDPNDPQWWSVPPQASEVDHCEVSIIDTETGSYLTAIGNYVVYGNNNICSVKSSDFGVGSGGFKGGQIFMIPYVDLCEGVICDDIVSSCPDGFVASCGTACNQDTGSCTFCVPDCSDHQLPEPECYTANDCACIAQAGVDCECIDGECVSTPIQPDHGMLLSVISIALIAAVLIMGYFILR